VATQLNNTASIWNSFPIEGRARLMAEPIKGMVKELSVAIINVGLFMTVSTVSLDTPLFIYISP
jgi:hypothetical protein